VIRLKFQNGFSYKQIAGITGLSVSNVGFLIHTGIQALRKRFRADGLLDAPGAKEIGDGHWG
jgi:RNA polymerase sigma-70 factor (ECF subfamily)